MPLSKSQTPLKHLSVARHQHLTRGITNTFRISPSVPNTGRIFHEGGVSAAPSSLHSPGREHSHGWCQDTWSYLRAVAVHFEGIDAGLVPALSLQEGAVFCQLQAGTPKMAPLEYFDPVMLAVLGTKGLQSTATPKKCNRLFLQLL